MHSVAVHTPLTQVCIRAGVTIATVVGVSQDQSHVSLGEGKMRRRWWTDRRYEPTDGLDGDAVESAAVTLTRFGNSRAQTSQHRDGGNDVSSGCSSILATSGLTHCHEFVRDLHGATLRPSENPHRELARLTKQQIRDSLVS